MKDKNNEQTEVVEIAINRIKLLSVNINERLSPEETAASTINIEQQLNIALEANLVILEIKISFTTVKTNIGFIEGKIQNVFIIQNLKKFANPKKNNEIDLPENVLVTIMSLSISHSRALIAQATAGTAYQHIYMPIVNPVEVTRQLFPHLTQQPKSNL